jgi:hypothetical protein
MRFREAAKLRAQPAPWLAIRHFFRGREVPGGWPSFSMFFSFRSDEVGAPLLRFAQGRVRCCQYRGVYRAQRSASHLGYASSAV